MLDRVNRDYRFMCFSATFDTGVKTYLENLMGADREFTQPKQVPPG